MTDKQIIINDYFNIMRDENGRIFCIQEIGDPKSLIKAIREQNEYIQAKEQECERLKWYLKEIRDDELKTLDIELDEYETHCIDTEYTNIINLVEEALEERSPEDCRYKKDK